MTGLADLYLSQEKLQEAEALCLKVVRGYEETLGRDIITTAFALLQLGSVYLAQRRFEEAKKIYLEILKKPMRKPGLEPHLAMFAALDLGWLYHIRGRFRGAESMFRRALGGFESMARTEPQANAGAGVEAGPFVHGAGSGGQGIAAVGTRAPRL
ncbi:hypothetical protein CRV24_004548 [Beauveria bassiana]|nr:hypothetical protein CRV24_004548 [Beauveria bassiana]